jgi:hypothetical protein
MMLRIDLLNGLSLNIKKENDQRMVWDIVRKKWYVLSPEEYVRQALVHFLIHKMDYPIGLISIEKQLKLGSLSKRYDLVVYDRNQNPWMLVECKAPEVAIDEKTLHQLLQYHSQIPCPYWLLSNGRHTYCANAKDIQAIFWTKELPVYP